LRTLFVVMVAAGLLGGGAARAGRAPVAVLWLDSVGAPGGQAEPQASEQGTQQVAALATSLDRALQEGREVRALDDPEVKRVLAEGGAAARVARRLAEARRFFAAQRLAEADAALAAAEDTALRELPVAEIGRPLGEIASLRLLCAEFLRDDAKADHAARLLGLVDFAATPEVKAAAERHRTAYGPFPAAPAVRVETDPPGAEVYVDLRPVGQAPVDLPLGRHPEALVDIEAPGYAKVHRSAPAAGTLAVALRRQGQLGHMVDTLRALADLPEADVAALGREVGAERVLVVRPRQATGGAVEIVEARVLDVAQGRWAKQAIAVALGDATGAAVVAAGDVTPAARLAAYSGSSALVGLDNKAGEALVGRPLPTHPAILSALNARPTAVSSASLVRRAAPPPVKVSSSKTRSAWKKWYTWVIAGGLGAAIVGVVVANRIGDDQVTVRVSH
jgi:hypothetical protein